MSRTLFIFRMEKAFVQMVHNRKFQPRRFLIFFCVLRIRVFTVSQRISDKSEIPRRKNVSLFILFQNLKVFLHQNNRLLF